MTSHNDTFAAPSTFSGYWASVLGPDRTAADVVREFDLAGGSRRDLDEWLGTAESEALSAGKLKGEVGAGFHERALHALTKAAAIYVVWGVGASSANVDGDVSLQPFTPWAGRDLVGEEWVGSFMGAAFDLDTDDAVTGYRALAEWEIREWRARGKGFAEASTEVGDEYLGSLGLREWVAGLGFEVAWERGTGDARRTGVTRGDGARCIVTNGDCVWEGDEGFMEAWEDGKGGEAWNAYAYIEEGSDEREHLGSAPTREMAARLLPCDAHGQRVGQLQRGEDGEVVNLP